MVRPHLEYGNVVWGPNYQGEIKMLDKFQRRATKMVTAIKDLPYVKRLTELKLPSLVYRRRRGDMIIMYKIMNGLVKINDAKLFSLSKITHTRGHCKKVSNEKAVTFVRATSFSKRVVNDWNHLPASIVEAASLNTFKNRLDEHWKHLWYLTTVG